MNRRILGESSGIFLSRVPLPAPLPAGWLLVGTIASSSVTSSLSQSPQQVVEQNRCLVSASCVVFCSPGFPFCAAGGVFFVQFMGRVGGGEAHHPRGWRTRF